MHFKDLLRSIIRVGYYISVPDYCLVLHGLRSLKSTIYDGLIYRYEEQMISGCPKDGAISVRVEVIGGLFT